jgi:type IV pilus assembly protein PilE
MMIKNGFTLIELLIAIAIIGILASIAYPSYQDTVRKTHRADAQGDLMELASFMERYYTENNTYVGAALPFGQSPRTGTAFYLIAPAIAAGPPSTYTLTATAQAAGGQSSDTCGNLTINNIGATSPTTNGCW